MITYTVTMTIKSGMVGSTAYMLGTARPAPRTDSQSFGADSDEDAVERAQKLVADAEEFVVVDHVTVERGGDVVAEWYEHA